jgi:hypothetical protein
MTTMSALARYAAGPMAFGSAYPGVSVDAQRIYDMLGRVAQHWVGSATGQICFAEPLMALNQIYQRCQASNWDGEGADPILLETVLEAHKLFSLLPSSVPTPELLPESTGAIAFEWYRGRNRVYVISVCGRKSIEFAGLYGLGNEVHGKVNFEDCLPVAIQDHLQELYKL